MSLSQSQSSHQLQSAAVGDALRQHEQAGKVVAAICASTIGLADHGIGKGATVTSHPSIKEHIEKAGE